MTQAANLGALGTNATSTGALTASSLSGAFGYANLPAGCVLQVVQGTTNTFTAINSTSYTDTTLSATITPDRKSTRLNSSHPM